MRKTGLVCCLIGLVCACQTHTPPVSTPQASVSVTAPLVDTDEKIITVLYEQVKALGRGDFLTYLATLDSSSIEYPTQKKTVEDYAKQGVVFKITLKGIQVIEKNTSQALVRFTQISEQYLGTILKESFESQEEVLLRKVNEDWKVFRTKILNKKYLQAPALQQPPPVLLED